MGQRFSACFVLFVSGGERGRKGRECKFQNKAHRTFHPKNNYTPCISLYHIGQTLPGSPRSKPQKADFDAIFLGKAAPAEGSGNSSALIIDIEKEMANLAASNISPDPISHCLDFRILPDRGAAYFVRAMRVLYLTCPIHFPNLLFKKLSDYYCDVRLDCVIHQNRWKDALR